MEADFWAYRRRTWRSIRALRLLAARLPFTIWRPGIGRLAPAALSAPARVLLAHNRTLVPLSPGDHRYGDGGVPTGFLRDVVDGFLSCRNDSWPGATGRRSSSPKVPPFQFFEVQALPASTMVLRRAGTARTRPLRHRQWSRILPGSEETWRRVVDRPLTAVAAGHHQPSRVAAPRFRPRGASRGTGRHTAPARAAVFRLAWPAALRLGGRWSPATRTRAGCEKICSF